MYIRAIDILLGFQVINLTCYSVSRRLAADVTSLITKFGALAKMMCFALCTIFLVLLEI